MHGWPHVLPERQSAGGDGRIKVAPLSQLDLLVFGEESSIGLSDHESKVGRSRLRSPRLVFDAMKGEAEGRVDRFSFSLSLDCGQDDHSQ